MTSQQASIPKSTVKSIRRRLPRRKDDNDEHDENRIPNLEDEWNTKGSYSQKVTNSEGKKRGERQYLALSEEFRAFEERIKKDIWKSNDALRLAVLQSSLRLGSLDNDEQGSSDCLLLFHEFESSLVKTSRVLVKEATECNNSDEKEQQFARLAVASHIIRALARFVSKNTTQEALLQLLYHIIQTLGSNSDEALNSSGDVRTDELMILAFEGLHHVFLRFKKETNNNAKIVFGTVSSKGDVFLFSAPSEVKGKGKSGDSGLAIDKICAIAIQALILVGKRILHWKQPENRTLPQFLSRLDTSRPLEVARHLLSKCAVEWIHFQVRLTKNLKEGLSHCKRIYKIIWDRATGTDLTAADSLLLRQDALSILLPEETTVLYKALQSKFAETACICACRASSAFVAAQTTTVENLRDGSLLSFHESIGTRLDGVFGTILSLSYLEYTSLRAQHVGIYKPTILTSATTDTVQTQLAAFVKITMPSIAVVRRINGDFDEESNSLIMESEEAISAFRQVFLEPSLEWCWTSEDISRITKLFPLNLLHKSMHNVTTNGVDDGFDVSNLQVGASILTRCIGVFLFLAAKSIKSERKKLCEKAIECFLRGISVLEECRAEFIIKYTSETAANEFIALATKYRLITAETLSQHERFAKFLSNSARRRDQQGGTLSGLHLSVASLRLFTEITGVSQAPCTSLLLSQRWLSLSSALAPDLSDASILTGMVSLLYDAFEGCDQTRVSLEEAVLGLFGYICSRSDGTLDLSHCPEILDCDMTSTRRGIITRLMRTLEHVGVSAFVRGEECKPKALSSSLIFDCLDNDSSDGTGKTSNYVEKSCCTPFSLSGILRVLLPTNVLAVERNIHSNSSVIAKIKLLLDIIYELGSRLVANAIEQDEMFVDLLLCHKSISRMAVNLAGTLRDDETGAENFHAIISSAIYYVASTSIAPISSKDVSWNSKRQLQDSERKYDNRELKLSISASALSKMAYSCISAYNQPDSDWSILADALRPIILHSREKYQGCLHTSPLSQSIRIAMDKLTGCRFQGIVSKDTIGSHLAVSFLSSHADCIFAQGEKFTALRLAEWCYRVASQLDRKDKERFGAAFLRKFSPSTVFGSICLDANMGIRPDTLNLDGLELLANKTQCRLSCSVDRTTSDDLCALLKACIERCDALLQEQPRERIVQPYWIQTILNQTLAWSFMARGDLVRAVASSKDSLRLCRQAFVASTRQISSAFRIKSSAMSDVTIIPQLEERQIELLLGLASLYRSSGDYRRAESYVISAFKSVGFEDLYCTVNSTKESSTLVETLYSVKLDNPRLTELRRIASEFALARSSVHEVAESAHNLAQQQITSQHFRDFTKHGNELETVLESIARLRLVDITGDANTNLSLPEKARAGILNMRNTPDISAFAELVSGRVSPAPEFELDLFDAKVLLKTSGEFSYKQETNLRRICTRITKSPYVSSNQRSEALFMLGIAHLRVARNGGALARLWHGFSNLEGMRLQFEVDDDDSLAVAKQCLLDALSTRGPASDPLTRNILRSLALVSGPEQEDGMVSMASWEIIHSSIGSSSRQRVFEGLHVDNESGGMRSGLWKALDSPFFSQDREEDVKKLVEKMEKTFPAEWRVVAVALCPTGELLLNTIECRRSFTSRTICIFPKDASSAYDIMMQPLDELIAQSQGQLQSEGTKDPAAETDSSQRREWWSRRERIDKNIEALARRVERCLFSSSGAQMLLHGESENGESDSPVDWECKKVYTECCGGNSPMKEDLDFSSMKVAELREALLDSGMEMRHLRKMRKADLLDLLNDQRRQPQAESVEENTSYEISNCNSTPGDIIILTLDEDVHRFPFEALPCLRGKTVCRNPSIPFVVAKLQELIQEGQAKACVDMRESSYILDPESNLHATRERISDYLLSLKAKLECEWDSVVGEIPPEEFFERNLSKKNGMVLFFGHGGGQAYFSRSSIERLIVPGERRINSSVILMGCSSGSLISVNRKKLSHPEKVSLWYEPEGVALSYLAAGAPCVIGNLWDVTDRDIDRFSMNLLDRFSEGEDLATSLREARNVCKMKYLNGYAPVYYGIPVYLKKSMLH